MSTRTWSPSSTSSAGEMVTVGGGGAGAPKTSTASARRSPSKSSTTSTHDPPGPQSPGSVELVLEAGVTSVVELHRVSVRAPGDSAERPLALPHRAVGAVRPVDHRDVEHVAGGELVEHWGWHTGWSLVAPAATISTTTSAAGRHRRRRGPSPPKTASTASVAGTVEHGSMVSPGRAATSTTRRGGG